MMKSDKQMATELLDKYKSKLEQVEELEQNYKVVSREWFDKLDQGLEDEELGSKMENIWKKLSDEKQNMNILARLTLEYVIKAEVL